jgi:hypothetical protein
VIGDRDVYRARFESWLSYTHLVKLSARDSEWLYPDLEPSACAEDLLRFASAVAALQCSRAGAVPPTLAEVSAFAATRT